MFLSFEMKNEKKYTILHEYYISNGQQQGVFYLLADEHSHIKEVFLPKEDMNGDFVPRKIKHKEFTYKAMGIQVGAKKEVIVHEGEWTKTNALNQKKKVPAKIYYFMYKK